MSTYTLTCENCRRPFEAVHHFARTCGPACRKAAQRSRDRARVILAAAPFFLGEDV